MELLRKEKLFASRQGVEKVLRHYQRSGTIGRSPGSGRLSRITEQIRQIVKVQMRLDDESIANQLHALLTSKGIDISLRTIECFHGHVIPRSGVQPSVLSYGALCSFRLLQTIGPG